MSPFLLTLISTRIDTLEQVLSDDIIFEVTLRHPKSVSTEEWNKLLEATSEVLVESVVEQIERELGAGSVVAAGGRSADGSNLAHTDTIEVRARLTPDAVKGLFAGLRIAVMMMKNNLGEE